MTNENTNLWCPYCDEVLRFDIDILSGTVWCTECKRLFPPNQWPKGFDIETGELKAYDFERVER